MRFQVRVLGPLGVRDSDTVEDAETCTRVDAAQCAPMRALSMIPSAGTCTRADMGAGACAGGLAAGGPALLSQYAGA